LPVRRAAAWGILRSSMRLGPFIAENIGPIVDA
jgi:hypothetical protein